MAQFDFDLFFFNRQHSTGGSVDAQTKSCLAAVATATTRTSTSTFTNPHIRLSKAAAAAGYVYGSPDRIKSESYCANLLLPLVLVLVPPSFLSLQTNFNVPIIHQSTRHYGSIFLLFLCVLVPCLCSSAFHIFVFLCAQHPPARRRLHSHAMPPLVACY